MSIINKRLAIKQLKSLCYTDKKTVNDFRSTINETFYQPILPNRVDCKKITTEGVRCYLFTPEACGSNRILLYIHGGSFIGGSCAAWSSFCATLAHESTTRVILPELHLAPEFPYPSAVEDAYHAFHRLYQKIPNIYLAADTSGASILLSLFFKLSTEEKKIVKGIALFSPWVDISQNALALDIKARKSKDPVMTQEVLKICSTMYTYDDNRTNPLVSPIYASEEELGKLPPIFIQAGGKELLLPDVAQFVEKIQASGSKCIFDIWKNGCHFFQFVENYSKDSHLAVGKVGQFFREIAQTHTSYSSVVKEDF